MIAFSFSLSMLFISLWLALIVSVVGYMKQRGCSDCMAMILIERTCLCPQQSRSRSYRGFSDVIHSAKWRILKGYSRGGGMEPGKAGGEILESHRKLPKGGYD